MKQIITLFLILSSFIVNAQEKLKFICSTDDAKYNTEYFLLTNTVKKSSFGNGNYLEAWVNEVATKKLKNKNVTTRTMIKFIVDCKNSRLKAVNTTEYDSNGQIIESKNYDFEYAPPESTIEYSIIKAICDN